MIKRFLITYNDPETGERISVEKEFADSPNVTAKEWAEDYAYSVADKGWNTVEELE